MTDSSLMLIVRFMNRNQDWMEAKQDELEARKEGSEQEFQEARTRRTRIEGARHKALKDLIDARDAGDELAAAFLDLPMG